MRKASKFIKLFISVNISARQGIGARLEAHKDPSKSKILLKFQYVSAFIGFQSTRTQSGAHHMLTNEKFVKTEVHAFYTFDRKI